MSKKEDKVYKVLCHIEAELERQNSTKRIFIQGLVRGLGTALGATVLLTLVTSMAIHFSSALDFKTLSQYIFEDAITD